MVLASALAYLLISQAAVWKPYTLGDGFTVDLPAKPSVEKDVDDPNLKTWTSIHPQGTAVSVVHGPGDRATDIDLSLGDYVQGLVEEGIMPTRMKNAVFGGWPGLDFVAKGEDGIAVLGRVYVSDKSIYALTIAAETEKAATPVAQRIFASFKLPKNLKKGPQAKAGPTLQPFEIGDKVQVSFPRKPTKDALPLPQAKGPASGDRYVSTFANLTYSAITVQIPDEAMEEIENASDAAVVGQLNDELIKGMKGKSTSLKSYKKGEVEVVSQTVSFAEGYGWARVDSFRKGNRFYAVLFLALKAAKNDKEVEEFFSTLTIG